uniref:Fibrinogen C-terminal domain-containing protein n=1 Tax=Plectus sambesii TaxID=2011161 RepID=A0A914WQN8_9BILA
MTDCYDWRSIGGASTDGIYQIRPPGMDSFDVWCDMTTDGGGWTVFQKRMDNCTTFWNRNWADYKSGFDGGLDRSYWLGLDRIHLLSTKDANITLRIDLYGNRCNHFYVYGCDPIAWWYGRGDDGLCSYYCLNGKYYPDDDGLDGTECCSKGYQTPLYYLYHYFLQLSTGPAVVRNAFQRLTVTVTIKRIGDQVDWTALGIADTPLSHERRLSKERVKF